ncbi:MAG TPA: hypothetical protein VFL72_05460 [Acidimicrobiia bacterium]|nr:hypothetical protein [Acidimicrobiia bacterium]
MASWSSTSVKRHTGAGYLASSGEQEQVCANEGNDSGSHRYQLAW